jgi:hypothetical protein
MVSVDSFSVGFQSAALIAAIGSSEGLCAVAFRSDDVRMSQRLVR